FVPSPANDWFFWPSGVMRTLEQMPGDKNYCFHPNDSHGFGLPGGTGDRRANQSENRTYMEIPFFDLVLRGRGKPFGKVREVAEPVREGNGVRVFFETDAPVPTKRAFVCHAAGELTWRMKWWRSTVAQSEDGRRFSAVISVDESGEPVSWFGVVVDERDVSTSTLVRSFEPKALGLDPENVPVVRFLEDFETPSEHRRWRMRYAERRPGRHRIKAKAFRSGKYGLEIVPGESTMACWGVRGATLAHSDAPKLVFWMRAVGEACPPPIVDLQAESPSGVRFVWQWKNPSDQLVSKEWCRVEAPLSQFLPKSKGVAPDMLSAQLGQLRFTTTTTTHVYIDDVSFE
ncbi:MAG: hypothetical protein KAI66_27835, partial [Lentisphaeria bacterium]|nr:hypothetical protein [Lentisphaeria bacterium]